MAQIGDEISNYYRAYQGGYGESRRFVFRV